MIDNGVLRGAFDAAVTRWQMLSVVPYPRVDRTLRVLANIDLDTKTVVVNDARITELRLVDCLDAVLSHEIGHAALCPATLAHYARLRLLERHVLPLAYLRRYPRYRDLRLLRSRFGPSPSGWELDAYREQPISFVNLFADFMVNSALGRAGMVDQLVRMYRAILVHGASQEGDLLARDVAFQFYLAMYEEMWMLPPGTLLGSLERGLIRENEKFRSAAQIAVESIWRERGNPYSEFLCFLSAILPYAIRREDSIPTQVFHEPVAYGHPSTSEWANALTPVAMENKALDRIERAQWFFGVPYEEMRSGALENRISGLPGFGTRNAEFVPEVMSAYYRQSAERFIVQPTRKMALGEPLVPTDTDEWSMGDAISDIDWVATVTARGRELGSAAPLKRRSVPEYEGATAPLLDIRVEIYLDVGGSMPDPRLSMNNFTLSAQILASSAIRHGGAVRLILYADAPVVYWGWCRSEVEVSRFLMHYVGGDTIFPLSVLQRSLDEGRQLRPTRVVIADVDSLTFPDMVAAESVFEKAIVRSSPFVFLLREEMDDTKAEDLVRYQALGATVLAASAVANLPKLAMHLAATLSESDVKRV